MENSVFETFSDKQMIKYMKYASPILGQLNTHLEVFVDELYVQSEKQLDSATLKDDLLKDLQHQQGFLLSVQKKLSLCIHLLIL